MNILLVTADPDGQSLAKSLADRYVAGIRETTTAKVELADLAAEGFDPRMTRADLAFYRETGPLPQDVRREQQRVERADLLLLATPIYWWSLPAVTKGWIDRVFTKGWAFGSNDRFSGPLSTKHVRLIATGAGGHRLYQEHGYESAMAAQIAHGIFNFSGVTNVETHLFLDVESGDRAARLRNLATAHDLGRAYAEGQHQPSAHRHLLPAN